MLRLFNALLEHFLDEGAEWALDRVKRIADMVMFVVFEAAAIVFTVAGLGTPTVLRVVLGVFALWYPIDFVATSRD